MCVGFQKIGNTLRQQAQCANSGQCNLLTALDPLAHENSRSVISTSNKNRSPCPDGLPMDFYGCLDSATLELLATVLNEICMKNEVPDEMKESIITLIHKEGRDPEYCGNYRPISLINCDMKILTKIWATRLGPVMNGLVGGEQAGFLQGKGVSDNTRALRDLMELSSSYKGTTVLVSLDAEKAFDNVCWDYLFELLFTLNFPTQFVNTLRSIYTRSTAKVLVNGFLSDSFEILRGTKQGCPLSPYLFNLCIEQLARSLRSSIEIQGVKIGEAEFKHLLYADDLLLVLRNPNTSIPSLVRLIARFSQFSGYKLNMDKSVVLELHHEGPVEDLDRSYFTWTRDKIKYLGMYFTSNFKDIISSNICALKKKLESHLGRIESIDLDLWAKVNVIKMDWLPKVLFVLNNLHIMPPASTFRMLDSLVKSLLWKKGKPMISRARLTSSCEKGGFGLPNFKLYQESFILKEALLHLNPSKNTWHLWRDIEYMSMGLSGIDPVTYLLGDKLEGIRQTLMVLKSSRQTLCRLKSKDRSSFFMQVGANLWRNPEIRVKNKSLFWSTWSSRGIYWVDQILDNGYVKSFSSLKIQFQLPVGEIWNYLILKNLLTSCLTSGIFNCSGSQSDNVLSTMLRRSKFSEQSMSFLYKILSQSSENVLESSRVSWSAELGFEISEMDWSYYVSTAMKVNINLKDRLRQQKIFMRLHWTPVKMFHLGLLNSDLCWRCNLQPGSYFHMVCDCVCVRAWWKEIMSVLSSCCGVSVQASSLTILFGYLRKDCKLDGSGKMLVRKAISVGLRLVLKNWKCKNVLVLDDWHQEMCKLKRMERVTFSLRGKLDYFDSVWGRYSGVSV